VDGLDFHRKENKVHKKAGKVHKKVAKFTTRRTPLSCMDFLRCVTVWFEGKEQNKEKVFGTSP
jgi:hypothetical protein